MLTDITIFTAKKVITMNPGNPEGTAVAVQDGRILGVGTVDELRGWGPHNLDTTFNDKILVPGFVEAHTHVLEGSLWAFPYIGYFDRSAPDGTLWKGCKSLRAALERMGELEARIEDPKEPLIMWGFDPIYFSDERLNALHLDRVSTTRPILIFHANGHVATVNSALMRRVGITRESEMEGVVRTSDGEPNGELQEIPAMALAGEYFMRLAHEMGSESAIWRFGAAARNAGCTTVTDLAAQALYNPSVVPTWQKIVNNARFPARVVLYSVPSLSGGGGAIKHDDIALRVKELQQTNTDKLRFGGVKLVFDGSIQSFTAMLRWPGYYNSNSNGQWLLPPEQFKDILLAYHKAGINVHVHCNGDRSVEIFIQAVDAVLRDVPWLNHRHTVQHSQLTSPDQYRRMARLGMCANIFASHLWYWGDQHYELTVGPTRARGMNACATAKRQGVSFSIHSDAPITPIDRLHVMWCAVNRVTPKGRLLGEHERISVYDAMYAATLGAAYQLHMDHEIGSIETGKRADFAVLGANPFEVDPMELKDIPVWGTVLGGVVLAN